MFISLWNFIPYVHLFIKYKFEHPAVLQNLCDFLPNLCPHGMITEGEARQIRKGTPSIIFICAEMMDYTPGH